MSRVAVVILAAGAGRRLGGVCKALLTDEHGVSFLERIAATATAAGCVTPVVVAGEPHLAPTRAEAERLELPWVVNPAPARGMASSIEVGFAHVAANAGADAALLWPVDHARVTVASVRAVIAHARPGVIAIPVFENRGGHPTLFGRELWPALQRCTDYAEGARNIVREHAAAVHRFGVDDPAVIRDVDTPRDRRVG